MKEPSKIHQRHISSRLYKRCSSVSAYSTRSFPSLTDLGSCFLGGGSLRQCQVFDAGQYVSGMDWCPMSEEDSASMLPFLEAVLGLC